jgi:hypothetical protein
MLRAGHSRACRRDYGRLYALAAVGGDAFDVEDSERHTA